MEPSVLGQFQDLGMAASVSLAAVGSALGTGAAGMAAIGAWKKCYVQSKAAPFLLLAFVGAPLTQIIYGMILMGKIADAAAGGQYYWGTGILGGLAMGASAVYLGTAFMATREYQASEDFKMKIVDQVVTDPENTRKIYEMKHGLAPSLASGVIDSVPSVREFIETMIKGAEEIMAEFKQWGLLDS